MKKDRVLEYSMSLPFYKKNQRMLDNSIAEMNLGNNKNVIKKYIF